jgi:hypothetical protein
MGDALSEKAAAECLLIVREPAPKTMRWFWAIDKRYAMNDRRNVSKLGAKEAKTHGEWSEMISAGLSQQTGRR